MGTRLKEFAALAAESMSLLGTTARASLVNLGNGSVQDTTTNLIWLYDWDVNGTKAWATQVAWADDLNFAGADDWRLPTIDQYLRLWVDVEGPIGLDEHFVNVRQFHYWSSTEILPGSLAFTFRADNGVPHELPEDIGFFAVALRAPEPATLALVGAALLGLAATTRKRRDAPVSQQKRSPSAIRGSSVANDADRDQCWGRRSAEDERIQGKDGHASIQAEA